MDIITDMAEAMHMAIAIASITVVIITVAITTTIPTTIADTSLIKPSVIQMDGAWFLFYKKLIHETE